eukprot:UN25955
MKSIAHHKTIKPECGELVFFQLCLTNPWKRKCKFEIRIDDPTKSTELTLVKDAKEWTFHNSRLRLKTNIKRDLFVGENLISCEGNENVFIPFRYQSFAHGRTQNNEAGDGIVERTIQINVIDEMGQIM